MILFISILINTVLFLVLFILLNDKKILTQSGQTDNIIPASVTLTQDEINEILKIISGKTKKD